MSNVTSVAAVVKNPPRMWPFLLIGLGGVAALAGLSPSIGIPFVGPLGGIVVLAAGVAWLLRMKPMFRVVLRTPSGDATALESRDKMWVHRVTDAVEKAIAARA